MYNFKFRKQSFGYEFQAMVIIFSKLLWIGDGDYLARDL